MNIWAFVGSKDAHLNAIPPEITPHYLIDCKQANTACYVAIDGNSDKLGTRDSVGGRDMGGRVIRTVMTDKG